VTVEKVGRAMSWNLLAKAARFAAAPAAYILIVRSLGKHQWGILSVLRTVSGLVIVVVSLGIGKSLLKYMPEMRVRGGLREFTKVIKRLFVLQAAVWGGLLLLSYILGPKLGPFFDVDSPRFSLYLMVAVGFTAFEVIFAVIMSTLQSWYETRKLGFVIVIGNIAYLLLLILFMKQEWGIIGVLSAGAVVSLGMSAVLASNALSIVRESKDGGNGSPHLKQILLFSLPFVVTGVLNEIVWRHSEVIFLGHYSGVDMAGFFSLAYRVPQQMLEFVPLSVWPLVMAGISEVYARDSGALPRAVGMYYRLLYILVIPIAAMGFAFSAPLVPILFGEEMIPAAPLMRLFFVVFSYSFLYTPLSMALYVMEKSWVNMLVFTLLAMVNIGLDLALIPSYGLWGAFIPVAFVMILAIAVFSLVLRRIRPDIVKPAGFILRCYAAALPTALLAITAARWSSPAALAIQIPIGAVLLFLGFRFARIIGEEEKAIIKKLPIPMRERIVNYF